MVDISVSYLDEAGTKVKHSLETTMKSQLRIYKKNLELLVVNRITKSIPSIPINQATLEIPKNVVLTDSEFHVPLGVHLRFSVTLFPKLLCVAQIELKGHPNAVLQKHTLVMSWRRI